MRVLKNKKGFSLVELIIVIAIIAIIASIAVPLSVSTYNKQLNKINKIETDTVRTVVDETLELYYVNPDNESRTKQELKQIIQNRLQDYKDKPIRVYLSPSENNEIIVDIENDNLKTDKEKYKFIKENFNSCMDEGEKINEKIQVF